MNKFIVFLLITVGLSCDVEGQTKTVYNPSANARAEIDRAVENARSEGKHVLLQIGGNWCVWCLRFNSLITENDSLSTAVNNSFIVVHVNYSKENKNEQVLASLGYPQRFGFPVFVILNGKGERLHTQNSAYLEEGEGHSPKKVLDFLAAWSPAALDPSLYESKTAEK